MLKNKPFKEIKNLLKEQGFKNTPARLAIMDIFIKNNKPISADFIYNKLKKDINETTVYRTLSSFEENGILRRVDLRRDSICFELNNDHHHHIICTKCGYIEDFKENSGIVKLLDQIIKKSSEFKSIKEHSLELFGFCKVCDL
jgi:Fe2+ or Zn2+ uptake regulation protein